MTGLAGDMAGAQRQMLGLARERRGTSTAAWSIYQAALAPAMTRRARRPCCLSHVSGRCRL
jgi:hypothetical protein